ncbi:Predicted nuclease of the RNAse H fold, HicB family [Lachnospiraceae bacterium NK3A20]|nr:Predicted nuclease of the RNAse H fold, HicB family [Lachnospiraceae bacterium NK3A20]
MKLVYPAIFTPFDDEKGYTVEFPDLPGCVTEGSDLSDAIYMAEDAASGWILTELEDGKEVPRSSSLTDIEVGEADAFASLIVLDIDEYARIREEGSEENSYNSGMDGYVCGKAQHQLFGSPAGCAGQDGVSSLRDTVISVRMNW